MTESDLLDMQTSAADDAACEPLTEELLARLLASATPEAYLSTGATSDRSFPDYLYELLERHGMTRAEVVRDAALNPTYVYQLFSGKRHPGRESALRVLLCLHCTLRETQRALRLAGVSELWCKNRRDAIIIFCVEHGYSLAQTDDELYRLGEPTLVPREV